MRPENMSAEAYRIVRQLKLSNIIHYCNSPGVMEVLAAGLAYIDDRRLAITDEGRAVPRVMRRTA